MLRPYQTQLIEDCRQAYRSGAKRVLLQAATGAGKTVIAAAVVAGARARGRRVLYVCHRDEIIRQTAAKLQAQGIDPALLVAGRRGVVGDVVLASAQTLARRDVPPADLIVIDEAHCLHASHVRLLERLPDARVLCLTATPCRLDGKPLRELADVLVSGPSMQQLTDDGWLVPAELYAAPSPDLHGVAVRAGEFDAKQLELAYRRPQIVGSVPEQWLRLARGRRTVLFAAGIDHSRDCVAALQAAGVRAVHVDGSTPDAERLAAFDALRRHEIDVLSNVGIAIEGLDIPEVSAIYWARATASLSVYLQGTGRGLRPAAGKADCVVIDGGGNVWRHGLPADPRVWSLDGKPRRAAQAPESLHTCRQCLAMWTGPRVCPRCGEPARSTPRDLPKHTDGELQRVTAAELERRARVESRTVPPRACPAWAVGWADYWHRLEATRAREGYALPSGGRFTGWTESRVWRRMRGA